MRKYFNNYPVLFVIIAAVIILIVGNLIKYNRLLNIMQIVGVMLLFSLYFLVLDFNLKLAFSAFFAYKLLAIALFVGILLTVKPLCKTMIYELFPKAGIILFKPGAEFSALQFDLRINSGFSTVLIATVGNALLRKRKSKEVLLEDERTKVMKEVDNLRFQLSLRDIYPHFVESIVSTGMGRSIVGEGQKSPEMLIKLNQVLRYVLDQDVAKMQSVPLSMEYSYFIDLIDMLQWQHDDTRVEIRVEADMQKYPLRIVPMSLVTILENAVKYTVFNHEDALKVDLRLDRHGLWFECRNRFNPVARDNMKSSKFGLSNLRERLSRDENKAFIEVEESGDMFLVRFIQQKLDGDEH